VQAFTGRRTTGQRQKRRSNPSGGERRQPGQSPWCEGYVPTTPRFGKACGRSFSRFYDVPPRAWSRGIFAARTCQAGCERSAFCL